MKRLRPGLLEVMVVRVKTGEMPPQLRRATHLLVQRSLKGSLTLIAKITFLCTSFTLIAKMRRQIRACLLNLRQSCRSRWQRRQHRLFVAASHSIEIFTRSSSSLRRAMPHNLTAGGCMAEVAMTTLTWTFVGGGELISYYYTGITLTIYSSNSFFSSGG